MKGLELAERYYLCCGKDMLERAFPRYKDRIACGLAGEGSDCLGFDDALSQDHDFGPGFCMWLTDEDEAEIGEALRAAYGTLPQSFMGYAARDPVSYGEQRLSAMRFTRFYMKFTGLPRAPESLEEWRRIPEHFLSAAVSGAVFEDALGAFGAIRKRLLAFYPEDIRLKKLAARAARMGQAGQYNYARCVKRGEAAAALCALSAFVEASCSMVHLLNRRYTPWYKWAHRSLADMRVLPEAHGLIGALCADDATVRRRLDLIEEICARVIAVLRAQGLTSLDSDFLLDHAPAIMRGIEDERIGAMHPMAE
ncbi:MAG: DUF4037 domain-containing protein [Clostridiales Family XIII bacterium]|jgi:hypothetical protein|nr:DUF4037 domain-containing protein [Clostridiales Family XIII bacterium]